MPATSCWRGFVIDNLHFAICHPYKTFGQRNKTFGQRDAPCDRFNPETPYSQSRNADKVVLPLLAIVWVAAASIIYYYGLQRPVIVSAMTLVIGALFLRETKDTIIVTSSLVAEMSS